MMQRIALLATALVLMVAATGCMGPCKLRAEGGVAEKAAPYEPVSYTHLTLPTN